MADKRQAQGQQEQAIAAETAGGQALSTGGQVVGMEATARELAPAEAETKELSPGDSERKYIFDNIRHPKKRHFLTHYGNTAGNVLKAAKFAGITRQTHYIWLRDDPEYAEAFEQAQQLALATIEAEIIRRGIKGFKEPLVYQGKLTGQYVRRYSDNLLMFYAKRRDPQYRDNWTQQIGIMAGNVQIAFVEPGQQVTGGGST
jgi:hypothetical protein